MIKSFYIKERQVAEIHCHGKMEPVINGDETK